MAKLIVCISSAQLIAGIWSAKSLQQSQTFQHSEAGKQAFQQWLRHYPNIETDVLLDVPEEEYRLATLPLVRGKDKAAFLQRKLQQVYPNAEYRAASFLTHVQGVRRESHYLFVALNQLGQWQAWLALMPNVMLVGIYLLAMMTPSLLKSTQLDAPNVLVCEQLRSGFRQTLVRQGQVIFSRLTPIFSKDDAGQLYQQEIDKTRLYLQSQQLLIDSDALVLLWHGQYDAEHIQTISHTLRLTYNVVTHDVGALELLYMQHLAEGCHPANLAPASVIDAQKIRRHRRAVNIASALLLLASIGLATYGLWQSTRYEAQYQSLAQLLHVEQVQLKQASSLLAESEISGQALKTRVLLAQKIQQASSISPKTFMRVLGHVLMQLPQVKLQQIDWQQNPDISQPDHASLFNRKPTADITLYCQQADLKRLINQLRAQSVFTQVTLTSQAQNQLMQGSIGGEQGAVLQQYQIQLVMTTEVGDV